MYIVLQCLDTLVQFGGFLSTHLSPEEYRSRVPKLNELGLEYHIPADVAFFVLRPSIHHAISVRLLVHVHVFMCFILSGRYVSGH